MASCSLIFKLRLLSDTLCTMFFCLSWNSIIWVDKPKKAKKHSLSVNFHKIALVFYSHADSVAVISNHFFIISVTFRRKILLNGHAVTQNYVFVVSHSETTGEDSHVFMIRHVKDTKVMKNTKKLEKSRRSANYVAYMSDCFIENCNTHTITFGYQRHFFSRFTFKLHLA